MKQLNIYQRGIRKTRFLWSFVRSFFLGRLRAGRYRDVNHFILFIGYPRSGHSLIAALLDAHPNILVSMEWGALGHLKLGFRKLQIFYSIERISRLFTDRLYNIWTGYSYKVEGQFQGRSDKILVIGDKLAGQTSMMLRKNPELLDQLEKEVDVTIKIVHVIRNPYDTIATIAKRALEKSPHPDNPPDLEGFSRRYFERVELMSSLRSSHRYDIKDIYHEDFIDNPKKELKSLVDFLGLDCTEAYLKSCSDIVFESPHLSRTQFNWSDQLLEEIKAQIESYDFLSRYSFHS